MKITKARLFIFFVLLIILLSGVLFVKAQVGNRIALECQSNGTILTDLTYDFYPPENRTIYYVTMNAGKCMRGYIGFIDGEVSGFNTIENRVRQDLVSRNITFNLNNRRNGINFGRGGFSIP